jgi:branched-subunit amino acid ABC-type transport system permease component
MGVDINQTIAITFFIGSALAGRGRHVIWGSSTATRASGHRVPRRAEGVHGRRARRDRQLLTGAALGGFIIGFIEVFAATIG